MQLKTCHNCHKKVSPNRTICPNCKADLSQTNEKNQPKPTNQNLTNCNDCNQEISKNATACPFCGAPVKKGISLGGIVKASFTLLFALSILSIIISFNNVETPTNNTTNLQEKERRERVNKTIHQNMVKKVTIEDFNWTREAFETTMQAEFVINNDNPFTIKDITIKCNHYAKSGTSIDSNTRTIYDTIAANQQRTFYEIGMGFIHSQVETSACYIIDVKR